MTFFTEMNVDLGIHYNTFGVYILVNILMYPKSDYDQIFAK